MIVPLVLVAAFWLSGVGFTLALCRAASRGNNEGGTPVAALVSNNGKDSARAD